jgi:hypothetical protein
MQGNIPGSQEHRRLLHAAIDGFAATEAYRRSVAALAAPVRRMREVLRRPVSVGALEEVCCRCFRHSGSTGFGSCKEKHNTLKHVISNVPMEPVHHRWHMRCLALVRNVQSTATCHVHGLQNHSWFQGVC